MWAPSDPIYRNTTASAARAWRTRHGRYGLEGTVCESCKLTFFPPRPVCPSCHSRELARRRLSRFGEVLAFAEDHSPLIGHAGKSRQPFALIRLEDGPSVMAQLLDIDYEAIKPGLAVEMVIRHWRREANGLYQYGFKFRPRRMQS